MVVAELEEDVGVLLVLEEIVELHDVPVVEGAVDADFGLELLREGGRGGREIFQPSPAGTADKWCVDSTLSLRNNLPSLAPSLLPFSPYAGPCSSARRPSPRSSRQIAIASLGTWPNNIWQTLLFPTVSP
jgi:hypothetical protein